MIVSIPVPKYCDTTPESYPAGADLFEIFQTRLCLATCVEMKFNLSSAAQVSTACCEWGPFLMAKEAEQDLADDEGENYEHFSNQVKIKS